MHRLAGIRPRLVMFPLILGITLPKDSKPIPRGITIQLQMKNMYSSTSCQVILLKMCIVWLSTGVKSQTRILKLGTMMLTVSLYDYSHNNMRLHFLHLLCAQAADKLRILSDHCKKRQVLYFTAEVLGISLWWKWIQCSTVDIFSFVMWLHTAYVHN